MLELNYRDAKPIYEQIMYRVRKLIISGSLQPKEKLPSVRELAMKLAISPNTIARAYKQLEAEGYVYTVSGSGTYVSEHINVEEHRTRELLQEFDEITRELLYLAVEPKELMQRVVQLEEGGVRE